MIRLEIDGRQYPVSTEWLVLGSADDCSIRLTNEGVLPRHALVKAVSDIRLLEEEMLNAAEALEFERAAMIRDQIFQIKKKLDACIESCEDMGK